MTAGFDVEASGLLDGLDGRAREERAELIPWLMEQGFTVEQIRGAFAPMLLPARRELGDDGTFVSAREMCEEHHVNLEVFQRMQRALGLSNVDDPNEPVLLRADGEVAAGVQEFIDTGFDSDQLIGAVRVLADGLSHAAEMMRYTALSRVLTPGATELEVAKASEAMVESVVPLLGPMIKDMLFLQLRHAMETEAVNASERAAGSTLPGAREVTVAFADLVGFTRLGEAVPPEDLEGIASRLSDIAHDVADPPVRLVKTIGDAVMFVCPDPVPIVEATLDLIAAADKAELPQLRVGIASGSAVSRAGDWFGSPVNVASRVTDVARPGAVLVAESTRDKIGEDDRFTWSFAGGRHLKGVRGETKLYRARRAETDSGGRELDG
jgi:adenylate cyclase